MTVGGPKGCGVRGCWLVDLTPERPERGPQRPTSETEGATGGASIARRSPGGGAKPTQPPVVPGVRDEGD